MRAKKLLFLATAVAASFSSCTNEDFGIPASEEYTRNFITEFGLIDPAQDWNLAEGTNVTVKVGDTPAHVKAYMKVDDTYYLVADLENVSGAVNIPFDMPEGTTDIMVKINGKRYFTAPGGTVDPAAPMSRELIDPVDGDVAQVSWVDYRLYTAAEIFPIIYPNDVRWPDYTNGLGELRENNFTDERQYGLIPEGDPKNYDNPNVIMDFWFKDVDENGLTIYPMYWRTSLPYHTIGIFYFVDENGNYCAPGTEGATMVRQDIFYDKNHGGDKQIVDYDTRTWEWKIEDVSLNDINAAFNASYSNIQEAKDDLLTVQKTHPLGWGTYYTMSDYNSHVLFEYLNKYSDQRDRYNTALDFFVGSPSNAYGEIETYGLFGGALKDGSIVFDWEKVDPKHTYASHGINIKVPKDLQFGFYLKRENGDDYGYFYSMTAYNCAEYQIEDNAIAKWTTDAANTPNKLTRQPFACTFKHPASGNYFFSFEDAADNMGEWDLNDLVFGIFGNFDVEDDDYREIEHNNPGEVIPTPPTGEEGGKDDPTIKESEDAYNWLLAVEDLGATDDFDFNDIVMGVSAVTVSVTDGDLPAGTRIVGNPTTDEIGAKIYKKVTFKALAAGGTRKAYAFYGDELLYPDGAEGRAEWHAWFGNGGISSTTMINTGYGTDNQPGATCTIYFGSFTLETLNGSVDAFNKQFKIGIDSQNTSSSAISKDYFEKGEDGYFVKPADAGSAPQMFLIPDLWDNGNGKWAWPKERSHISSCYSGFADWVKDGNGAADWYKTPSGDVIRY